MSKALPELAIPIWVLSLALAWFAASVAQQDLLPTLTLLLVVAFFGVNLISKTSRALHDRQLLRLRPVYFGKLAFLLLALGAFWSARLFSQAENFGGDQERAYFDAIDLADAHFSLGALPGINYGGILFYYAGLFSVFGSSPFIPALVNSITTLLAALLLIRVGYKIKRDRGRYDWRLGLWIVIPEVLLHDVMTSRDTLAMSLIAISVLSVADYVLGKPRRESSLAIGLLALPALVMLAAVRTTALIPAVLSIVVLLFAFRRNFQRLVLIPLLVGSVAVLLGGSYLAVLFGAYQEIDYVALLLAAAAQNVDYLDDFQWSDQSIGRLLIPSNVFEAIIFTFPRLVLYLVAPLPNVSIDWIGLATGNWESWQFMLMLLSSVVYLSLFPYCLASLVEAIKTRGEALALHIPFWITMFAIAGGNQIIHERYRLMAVPLMWGCIWLGARRSLVRQMYYFWFGLLLAGGVFYLLFK